MVPRHDNFGGRPTRSHGVWRWDDRNLRAVAKPADRRVEQVGGVAEFCAQSDLSRLGGDALWPYCAGRPSDALVFEHQAKPGQPICGSSVYRRFRNAAKRAGLPVLRFHNLQRGELGRISEGLFQEAGTTGDASSWDERHFTCSMVVFAED